LPGQPQRDLQSQYDLEHSREPAWAKTPKRGRKQRFDPTIFEERFRTIERVFAWEDKFCRLLLRFERISDVHYALRPLAYTMINPRHYCRS